MTAANSVALGAGSIAGRGALTGYVAPGLSGTQTSAGEVSVGAPGALRQITHVAAGSAPTDAATVGQVTGVRDQVTALADAAVQYNGPARDRVTLTGAAGTVIGNLAPGAVSATSTEAVNGSQLFATNAQVAANTAAIAGISTGAVGPVRYSTPAAPTTPNAGTVTEDVTLVGTATVASACTMSATARWRQARPTRSTAVSCSPLVRPSPAIRRRPRVWTAALR